MAAPLYTRDSIQEKVNTIFKNSLHKKRQDSLADAALGVLSSEKLQLHHIGEGLAGNANLEKKHAVKQVDRLMSNPAIEPRHLVKSLVPFIIGERKQVLVSVDWTDFDADNQSTVSLNMATEHGRATPLMWQTVDKSRLKYNRAHHEDELLTRLREVIPYDIEVIILADRGFSDHKFIKFLGEQLGFYYLVRSKSDINVTDKNGNKKVSKCWLNPSGKMKCLENAKITNEMYGVDKFICLQAKAMKDPWYLVSNCHHISAATLVKYYGKRWGIECYFRDLKSESMGWGLQNFTTNDPKRRDCLMLICALAIILLTLLGKAGEVLGFDKKLKVNTSKKRTHSLFRQGVFYQKYFGNFTENEKHQLMEKYEYFLEQVSFCKEMLSVI
jgi:hypothetical protein